MSELSIGKSVESVDGTSFSFCTGLTSVSFHCKAIGQWFGQNYIKEVTIGDEVERIGDGALSEFLGLTSFKMPNSVTTIGNYAFRNCTNLETIVLSENLNSIGEGGFYGCSTLKKIDLPNSLTSIGNYVFYACHGLNSFVIPNSITGIGEGAFYGCHLSTVTIGSNVKTINNSFNYPIIKTIWLGNTPPTGFQKAIGTVNYVSNDSYQFQYYPGEKYIYPFLSSIFEVDGIRYVPVSPSERICDAIDCVYDSTSVNTTVGSQVSYRGVTMTVRNVMPYLCYNNGYIKSLAWKYGGDLPKYAFAECSNIQQFYTDKSKGIGCLVIDGKVSNIGDYAFSGCKEFDTVIISDRESPLTLGSNGSSPLFSSFALDSVYIGGNLSYPTSKDFGYSPFYSNTTLRSVVITDKETEISPNEFYGCTNLQNVRIGDNVKTIGDYAFSGCSSLKHFAFGTSVETIGREAFSDCVSVGRIISKSKTPPVCGTQALDDINKWDCQLSVPAGCLSAYQAADQWKEFFFVDEKANEEGVIDNPDTPGMQKCATPTVAYKDGQLTLASTTEGAECVWAITSADVRSGRSNTIDLANQYVLTVYATKDGWQDSDRVTARLVWGDAEVEGDNVIRIGAAGGGYDVNGDGQVDVADIAAILSKMAGYSRQVTSDK